MYQFKIGDIVEFELCKYKYEPRWNCMHDNGSSGVWQKAEVTLVEELFIETTHFTKSSERVIWSWPLEGESDYSPDQWYRPGFLRLFNTQVENNKEPPCVCESPSMHNFDCEWLKWKHQKK